MNTPINGERINRIYVNVDPGTNWGHRGPVMDKMRQNPLATFVNRSSYFEYLMEMKHFKWVCSPKGNGADCHRTWEALYLGSVPIVKATSWPFHFLKLPVATVTRWNNLTQILDTFDRYESISVSQLNKLFLREHLNAK